MVEPPEATRVRNKIKRLGGGVETIRQMLEEWALAPVKVGFENLLEAGLPEQMAEYIVAYSFPERFTDQAVASAKAKLDRYGITPPRLIEDHPRNQTVSVQYNS